MNLNRRHFLLFFGATVGSVTTNWLPQNPINNFSSDATMAEVNSTSGKMASSNLSFQPLKMALPLEIDELTVAQQLAIKS